MQDILQLETQQAHFNPAFNTLVHDGWVLRLSQGYSLCTDSVWALRQGDIGMHDKVQYCEEQFQLQHLACTFRLTPLAHQQPLDSYLRRSGYRTAESGRVLTRPLTLTNAPTSAPTSAPTTARTTAEPLKTLPLTRWLDLCYRLNPEDRPGQRLQQEQLLSLVELPMWCAVIEAEGIAIGYGRAMQSGTHLYLDDVWLAPDWRRRGHGRRLLAGLQRFGQAQGATLACLTVSDANIKANAFFQQTGFSLAYPYHYLQR